ncbi:MAG: DinB family protein [Bacillota bacterium]
MPTMDVTRHEGLHPAVGAYLSALDLGRSRLINSIKNLSPEQLEQRPAGFKNSIATLVVHCAATEVSFAHRIMGKPVPEELLAEFPPHKEELLPVITGETAESLQAKLQKSRAILQEAVKGLTAADLTRVIQPAPDRSYTVEWLLALLPVHLMGHVGHIQMIRQHQ